MDLDYELETCIEKKISKGESVVTDPDINERELDVYDNGKSVVRSYFP